MKIYPAIDIYNKKCVRLTQGDFDRSVIYDNDPVEVAKEFERVGAQFLHVIDLEGAKARQPQNAEVILDIVKNVKIPVQVGGGICDYKSAEKYLKNGVERIILSSMLIENPDILSRLVKKYGSSRIVFSLDIRNGKFATAGWRESAGESLESIILLIRKIGIKVVIVTDISRDGKLEGPNFELMKQMMREGFELITAGGVTSVADLIRLKKMGIDGAIVGKALYEKKIDLTEALSATLESNLAKRIIPCMDIKDGRVVKGIGFKNLIDAGDPVALAKFYSQSGADELVFLDITATNDRRKTLAKLVERIAKEINIPFTVGGGIKSLEDIRELLKAGADKVSIGSAAVENPDLVGEASEYFGSQCIVVSVDAKRTGKIWKIYINGGTKSTGIDAIKFAKAMARSGAGELLVNSLDRDGTKSGFDIELLNAISCAVNIPIIASSGAGSIEDFVEVFTKTNVDAALAAGIFHNKTVLIEDLKKTLQRKRIRVRF